MSLDGPKPSSEGADSDARVVLFERVLLSIVLGGLTAFGGWTLIGVGIMVSTFSPVWIPFVIWPIVSVVLYFYDKATE